MFYLDRFGGAGQERAIDNCDQAVVLDSSYTRACLNKGIALVELGSVEEAGDWFRNRIA